MTEDLLAATDRAREQRAGERGAVASTGIISSPSSQMRRPPMPPPHQKSGALRFVHPQQPQPPRGKVNALRIALSLHYRNTEDALEQNALKKQ